MPPIGSFQLHTFPPHAPSPRLACRCQCLVPLAAQDPAPATAVQPDAKSLLTPEQMKSVLTQLDELEKTILAQRGCEHRQYHPKAARGLCQ